MIHMPLAEIPFFEDPDYPGTNLDKLVQAIGDTGTARAVGIKRPSYLHLPYVHTRLHQHLPDARYIAILRNPLRRIQSAYYHYMRYGLIPVLDPNRGFERILNGQYNDRHLLYPVILEGSLYGKHLSHFLQLFPREQLLVLPYEDLVADAQTFVQRAYRFLGVDDTYIPQDLTSRPQATVYSIPKVRVIALQSRLRYNYFHNHTRLTPKEMNWLERKAFALLTRYQQIFLSSLQDERIKLNNDIEARLKEIFAADIARLEDVLDMRFDQWGIG